MRQATYAAWLREYRREDRLGADVRWPRESLVRLLKGGRVPHIRGDALAGLRVLDVGCGSGANLRFLASEGMECHGVEPLEEGCARVRRRLDAAGVPARIAVGNSRDLPYADGFFDLLVSWQVLHYEADADGLRAALIEYRRVLRPGGSLLAAVLGPRHHFLKNCNAQPGQKSVVNAPLDFHNGLEVFVFKDQAQIRALCEPLFASVLVGRVQEEYFTSTDDTWIIAAVKGL